MKKLLITLLVVCLLPISRVQALDNDVTPNAKSAILIEANSRQILYDKNAEEKLSCFNNQDHDNDFNV